MKILSNKQLLEANEITIKKNNITFFDLMEYAGVNCFKWIHARLQGNNLPIKVFCGTGNNGGTGLVIARHLKQHGYNVFTYVVNFKREERTEHFLKNYDRLKELGVWAEMIKSTADLPQISENDMVIDAIFGLGLAGAPRDILKETIQHINKSNAYILSIDMPSGLYADRAVEDKDAVVKAYQVLTFQTPKMAFLMPENQDFFTFWEVVNIGLDPEYFFKVEVDHFILEKQDILPLYIPRKKFSHKGNFGHSLLIGGSYGKIGAVILASRAALNMGSGLVTAYVPKCGYQVLQTALPEVMVETSKSEEFIDVINSKVDANVVGVGTGLGTETQTKEAFESFLKENKLPLVIDADAINLLSQDAKLLDLVPENSVLTPHPKEFERLVGECKSDFDQLEKAKELAKKYKIIVVLKGAHTFITNGNKTYFNSTGTPALATAGTGDVLTGIITGLIAQGYSNLNAAVFGVYLHGKTSEVAMQDLTYETFTANDSIDYLSDALKDLFKRETPESEPEKKEKKRKTS